MAAIAVLARARLVSAAALLGLTLLAGREPPPPMSAPIPQPTIRAAVAINFDDIPDPWAVDNVITPPDFADASDYPHGMVMGRNEAVVDHAQATVTARWLSGLLGWLASRAA
jgi:hypothetical protein